MWGSGWKRGNPASVLLPEAGEKTDQSLPCSVQGGVRGENALGEQGQAVRGRILTPPERSRRPARGAEFLPVQ